MAGINGEVKMQDDREAREEAEQETEVYDDIAQNAGKEEKLEHGGSWKFDGKTDRKGSIVVRLQESSTGDEDMDDDQSNLLACDFFSVRDTARLADYLHGQAEEIARSFRLYSPPSICCSSTPMSIDEDEQSLSPRERNILAMPQQSKLALAPSKAVPHQFSCLEMPLNLPPWLGAGGGSDSSTNERRRSEIFEIRKWRSVFQLIISEKVSTIVSRPRSTTLRELNGRKWHEYIVRALHSSQNEGRHSEDLSGIVRHRDGERLTEGKSCGFAVKILSPTPRRFSASTHFLAGVPESFGLALPQQIAEIEHAQVRCSTQVTSPSICCVDSSQLKNFGAELITVNEPSLSKVISGHHRSEENDAMSESGGLEKCKQEDLILTLGVEKTEALKGVKSESGCALDLLVSAIQVTSGGRFSGEDDVPGPSEMVESVIGADIDAPFESEEIYFLFGKSPIVKKRVIRRARNAFKKEKGGNSLLNAMKFHIPELVPQVTFGRRKRKRLPDEKHGDQQKENESNLTVREAAHLKDGDPVIRSKRGRYQVLPTKFSESVLQPWKRMPRRKTKFNLV